MNTTKKFTGKRTLKYAILGLLSRQPMTGYDITCEFQQAIGQFWQAKHSQIYPELKKLLIENLISQQIEMKGELEKKCYQLTELGKQALEQWLCQLDEIESEKDVFALRLYFLHAMPKTQLSTLFTHQLEQKQARLAFLHQQLATHFSENFDVITLNDNDFAHYLVLSKAIAREQSYYDWLVKSWQKVLQRQA